jgi:hypothetical protein
MVAANGLTLVAGPLLCLIWSRPGRYARRVTVLAAQVAAGTLPPPVLPATPRGVARAPRAPRTHARLSQRANLRPKNCDTRTIL